MSSRPGVPQGRVGLRLRALIIEGYVRIDAVVVVDAPTRIPLNRKVTRGRVSKLPDTIIHAGTCMARLMDVYDEPLIVHGDPGVKTSVQMNPLSQPGEGLIDRSGGIDLSDLIKHLGAIFVHFVSHDNQNVSLFADSRSRPVAKALREKSEGKRQKRNQKASLLHSAFFLPPEKMPSRMADKAPSAKRLERKEILFMKILIVRVVLGSFAGLLRMNKYEEWNEQCLWSPNALHQRVRVPGRLRLDDPESITAVNRLLCLLLSLLRPLFPVVREILLVPRRVSQNQIGFRAWDLHTEFSTPG